MKSLTTTELRKLFLEFFRSKGHTVIPSASLIPENDPTVLFTTAGMHPLVPYLMGAAHPAGKRLTDVQKCVRTGDIDSVGDASHLTFFEMLGNWSLGDYFKKESIAWSWELLTDEKWLGIDKDRLYFTCFEGNENAPRDTYSHDRWVEMGVDPSHIFYLGAKHNWWIPGTSGPCGPDTEIFFDTGKEKCCESCDPSCSCGKYLEIWNNVFMEYFQPVNEPLRPLEKKNVDTGMGLERTIATLQGAESVYDTDAFVNILAKISELSGKNYKDNADTIEGNCDTTLFLGGKEKTTLKEIAEILGKETIDLYNTSDTRGSQRSYGMNYQKTGKELMSQDEIAVMDGGKCILQVRGVRPFFSNKYDICKHKN